MKLLKSNYPGQQLFHLPKIVAEFVDDEAARENTGCASLFGKDGSFTKAS